MACSNTRSRRRDFKATPPLDTRDVLRKSGTFHSPTSASSNLYDPLEDLAFRPKRSPTNPKALERLLIDAGEQRVAAVIASVDRVLANKPSSAGDASILIDHEVHPVPTFMVNRLDNAPDDMEVDKKPVIEDHENDSGLGSSVSGSNSDHRSTRSSVHSALTSDSAITRSFSTIGSMAHQSRPSLSDYATEQIQRHIVNPILREDALKDFHPLVKDVPRRIGAKSISNLRDLEKTLLYLAPEYSASSTSYRTFCEASIRCLITTVDYLNDRDQRLPSDRPYTNNYFIDLVEQIHRYAQLIAETREKEEAGKQLDEMDYSPDEKITLAGGLSRTGKPAELVREKNGKVIPITESSSSDAMITAGKRSLEEDDYDDEDGVHRSMARRRKSDKPGDVSHTCRDCKKEFKRPCDLTKHEKTHSRPWKCFEEKCKYHEYGWPTEKERERHMNDKHSDTPRQYKCLFKPCTYSSKRESNCKQHMEKAHGWQYVRSKSNGRKKAASTSNTSLQTPQTPPTPLMGTPSSAFQPLSTPITPFAPSPSVHTFHDFNDAYRYTPAMSHVEYDENRRTSVTTAGTAMTYSSSRSSLQPPSSFENAITPEDHSLGHNPDFTFFDEQHLQQPTPALSVGPDPFPSLNAPTLDDATLGHATGIPHLSPGAHPDAMLFSPQPGTMDVDEGFSDAFNPTAGDFQLFDTSAGVGNDPWFGGQFDNASFYHNEIDDFMEQCNSSNYPTQPR